MLADIDIRLTPRPDQVVTFFASYAATTKREVVLSPAALAELIRTTTADDKGSLPWLKCARFGDQRTEHNSLRHNANVLAITGIEADYDGEQMGFDEAERIVTTAGLCAIIYTSPSHTDAAPRWRVLCFCSREYPPAERARFLARLNGLLGGIFSHESWTLSQSYYFGSVKRNPAHRVVVVDGTCIDLADYLDASAILPAPQEAQAALREDRSRRVADPPRLRDQGDSLIEQIRARLDLASVLAGHGYARRGNVWRHPNSKSGAYGLNIATFGGVERLYSHNGGDPLHPGNLPSWTNGVTAVDAFDVVVILDFGGDRTRALHELAMRFGLTSEARQGAPFERLWGDAVPLSGTTAATWLQGQALGHLIDCPELRFHSACPHPTSTRQPALVAAVRGTGGRLAGIHRIYIRHDGSGLADIEPQRAALGQIQGSAIRLASLEDVLSAGELVIGVDLEEVASLALLLEPERPAWAAVLDANLGHGLVLPTEIKHVVIADDGGDGIDPAYRRLKREGREVLTAAPDADAATFNQILRGAVHE
jgi:hypothetical protein